MGNKPILTHIRRWKNLVIALLIPILAAPLPIVLDGPEARCGYCLIIIALYWILEVIPLAVTSLLPVVLFPLFDIMPAKEVSMSYFKETLMLFLGSLIVAVAVEKWNLHKRLALFTLTHVGPQPRWLLLGVMLPTWFLSMWMSNTATTAMMIPIVMAILEQIKECQEAEQEERHGFIDEGKENVRMEIHVSKSASKEVEPEEPEEPEERNGVTPPVLATVESGQALRLRGDLERRFLSFAKTFTLATAYSANIGGVSTLTGTPPNVIFKGMADDIYKPTPLENPINFASWLALGVPLSTILVFILWLWMQFYMEGISTLAFWRKETTDYSRVKHALQREYDALGKMSYAEISVAIVFLALALLWITRKPGFIPGWADLFDGKTGDSTPAVLAAIVLFLLPSRPPEWFSCSKTAPAENVEGGRGEEEEEGDDEDEEAVEYMPLLDWRTVNAHLAWGVLFLMGGGFALADGCERSGLSAWVAAQFQGLSSLPTWLIILLLTIIIAMATEVTSNAATTTLFVPIVGQTAITMGINPLAFMIPCAIAASLAFLLPVATPPNAIVFASGYLRIKDMVKCGAMLNVLSVIIVNVMMNTWAIPVYNLSEMDPAFNSTNYNATDIALEKAKCAG